MAKELDKELRRIARAQKFRRDHYLIPTDYLQLKRIDKMIRDLPIVNVVRQIAYDEGADITDGATDDEK